MKALRHKQHRLTVQGVRQDLENIRTIIADARMEKQYVTLPWGSYPDTDGLTLIENICNHQIAILEALEQDILRRS